MTFHPLAAQAVREIVKPNDALPEDYRARLAEMPPPRCVCELGNQRFTAEEPFPSTEAFYLALGFESYTALDVNTEMGARVVDLNKPIQGRHYDLIGKFDLVTNNGTGEHIFNQDAVFQNVHDLAKVGGAMLHILPMSPWVNHGFFNYNPILFRDIAIANGYEWLFLWISDRWGNRVEIPQEEFEEAFREKKPKALEGVLGQVIGSQGYDASIVVAWRKTHERGFRRPFQGKYVADIADTGVEATYAR